VLKLRAAAYWITYIRLTKPAHFCVCACLLWIVDPRPSPFFVMSRCAPASERASSRRDRTRTCAADQARGIVAPPQCRWAPRKKKWALRGKMGVQR
jgi:hypothetical protein